MKELWFRHYEQLLNNGHNSETAAEQAYTNTREQLADWVDLERKRAKEQKDA